MKIEAILIIKANVESQVDFICTERGCDLMEIGTLNQRITFLVNRVVTDEIGNHTAVWDEAFSCWARVTLKYSVEHTDAWC